jgi:GTPase
VGCTMHVNHILQGEVGKTAQVHMQRQEKYTVSPTHVHIAVCGEFDSGKTTLLSVLITGNLDNGHGIARNQIVRHNHELETGRTSSISHHSVCFSDSGEILSKAKGKTIRDMHDIRYMWD